MNDQVNNVAESGGNITKLKAAVVNAVSAIQGYKSKRGSINSDIAAIIEDLEAQGINRHALRSVIRYVEMSETQRNGFDFAYELVREAMGEPLQPDLPFDGVSASGGDPEAATDPETGAAAQNPEAAEEMEPTDA